MIVKIKTAPQFFVPTCSLVQPGQRKFSGRRGAVAQPGKFTFNFNFRIKHEFSTGKCESQILHCINMYDIVHIVVHICFCMY